MSNLLKTARAKTKLILMGGGLSVKSIDIPVIPKQWETFRDSTDEWINVEYPESENSTCCVYKAKKGNYFAPHKHKFSDEMITITNKEGKAKIITDNDIVTIGYGETYVIPYGRVHAVEWLEDTTVFIIWHPHFEKGWEADEIKEYERSNNS